MEHLPALLDELKAVCGSFPDARGGRSGNIAMADFGLSAFSMFFMQSESFLSYQRALDKGHGRSNCQTLFGIGKIPTDNYIRDNLDPVAPSSLQPCFLRMEKILAEQPSLFHAFRRLDGTVVAPGTSYVVPLMPEFIANKDGTKKQDCERNAVKRWFAKHGTRMTALRPVYLGDDLFACQPVTEMVKANGDDFIFTCKETSHKALYDFMNGATKEKHEEKIRKRTTTEIFRYRWIPDVPLRDGKDAMFVNWIGFQILDAKGKIKYTMAWVTSLPVSKENVAEIVACGRARWKIENEGFNVMKNHGHELEHNFGHGKQFLAMTMAAFNLLAFAWYTILDLLEPPWQAAREASTKRTRFFTTIVALTSYLNLPQLVCLPQIDSHLRNPKRHP